MTEKQKDRELDLLMDDIWSAKSESESEPEEITLKKQKGTKKMSEKKPQVIPAKQPKSIKLSTIWKVLVYTFAVIGLVLSIMYVNDIFNGIVESRAEAKAQEILKAQSVGDSAPATQSKASQ